MATNKFSFTTLQILQAIANWKLEPFTLRELNFLLSYFCGRYTDNLVYNYAQDDIESLILEILSEVDN